MSLLMSCIVAAAGLTSQTIEWDRIVLTDRYYCDGITSGDINGDGQTDIVAGPFWYQGPDFRRKHEIYDPVALKPEESPSNSMFSFVHDFNGDGRPDVLVLGRVHKHAAMWYENPGPEERLWESHFVFERVRGESPQLVDLDGDGRPQLICHWDGRWGWIEPMPDQPTAPWTFRAISEPEDWNEFYHGEGIGDVNGDGRPDLVINDGWFEQPADRSSLLWTFHRQKFSKQRGGAQMFVDDVDHDGDADVISSVDAHGWGLAWYQNNGQKDGLIQFSEQLIMGDRSQESALGAAFTQPHALAYADIDGDGEEDIITGKRRWAHGPTGDIEPNAPPVVYWFRRTTQPHGAVRFEPHLIDDRSGTGTQITVADVNSDGHPDVLTVSKLGSFVFIARHN